MKLDPEALGLTKASKYDPDPNTVDGEVDVSCPACFEKKIVKIKPCCGARKGSYICRRCGYKEIIK